MTVSGGRRGGRGKLSGQRLRLAGKLRDEARGAGFDVLALAGIAEADLRRGAEQAGGDGARQAPSRAAGWRAASRLSRCTSSGKQRMGCARGGPGVFGCAHEPDGVGGEAGGFGRAGNLDGRVAGLGGEEGLVEGAGENGEKLRPADAAAIEAQRGAGFDGLLPAAQGLELGARKRTSAGPAGGLQATAEPVRPIRAGFAAWRACSARRRWASAMWLTQAGGESAEFDGWAKKCVQRVQSGALQAAAAQGAHIGLERRGFLRDLPRSGRWRAASPAHVRRVGLTASGAGDALRARAQPGRAGCRERTRRAGRRSVRVIRGCEI